MEARRARLKAPAWIVLDDCNTDVWQTKFHVEEREPLGRFSYAFVARIRGTALRQLEVGRLRPVPRR